MILEFQKTHDGARTPERANPSDAGLDVFYSPRGNRSLPGVYVAPSESIILPTGLKFGVPHGYMLEVKNRSGNAAKKSLLVGACVIDSGYEGEVFINLHNVGREPQYVHPGDKIAQVVLIPVVHFRPVETIGSLYGYPMTISNRGDGALGSTDNNTNTKGK
jgi:dUTP pyrophosphatase